MRTSILLASILVSLPASVWGRDSLKPPELVEKHLQAIGPAALLQNLKTVNAQGAGKLTVLVGGSGMLDGPASLWSDQGKFRMQMRFGSVEYPGEDVAFDGERVEVAVLKEGKRSTLGDFLRLYNGLVKEGLFGGVLSTGWALGHLEERNPKLKYRGLKGPADAKTHQLSYEPRRGSRAVKTMFHFDPETFRHVQSVYRLSVANAIGARPQDSPQQQPTRKTLKETFGEFKEMQGLVLPTFWKLEFSYEVRSRVSVVQWEMRFGSIESNGVIDPGVFVLHPKR